MDDNHHINEKKIVESLKSGDFEAFDQLFWCYHKRLYHFALSILKNKEDARDVVQEAFLRIWKNKENLDQQSSFQSFLFTISYNIIVDMMRKKVNDRNFRNKLFRNSTSRESPVDKEVEFKELNAIYRNAIEELPAQRKKIYRLHKFEHLKYEEIAEKLDISVNTVKSQMNKALTYIRTKVGTETLGGLLFLWLYL
jgi:RNA polymerase sigma-70 factor (ECF subfamily)